MSVRRVSDESTLRTLYEEHHGWLFNLLRRRLKCPADAADLAQDAFVRLLTRPREFDSHSGARAYLSTVARGLCVDLWRRRAVERAWLESLANQPELETPTAEQQTLILEILCELDQMLQRLSAKAAKAFVKGMLLGMTDREIAVDLGVSDRMVRKYNARAMLECLKLESRLEREAGSTVAGWLSP